MFVRLMTKNTIGTYTAKTRYLFMSIEFWADILNHFYGMEGAVCDFDISEKTGIILKFKFPDDSDNKNKYKQFVKDFWSLADNVLRTEDTEDRTIGFNSLEDLHFFTLDFWSYKGKIVNDELMQKRPIKEYDPSQGLPPQMVRYLSDYAYPNLKCLEGRIKQAFYMASFDHPLLFFSYTPNDLAGGLNAYHVQISPVRSRMITA